MPATGSLVALMKEWPLNNAMLSTTTHSKLREVLDGTDTQVATYIIDRWMAKMKGAKEYITREISRRKKWQFGRHQKALVVQYQRRRRRTHPRTRPEDGLWPSPQLCRWRSCSPTILPNRWRSPWARFFTKFIILGLLGLGSLTSTVKDTPPNWDPITYFLCTILNY